MKKEIYLKTGLLAILIWGLTIQGALAGTIRGFVLDKKTKEALIGAGVVITEDLHLHDLATLDGSFNIKNVKPGTYHITAQFIGYAKQDQIVQIKDDKDLVTVTFLMEEVAITSKEIIIRAERDKETDSYAQSLEKKNENVSNILSAKTIQLMPDITVGAVLQRVSGINISKSASGEGKSINIRGMEKRYNYTLIDGIKIASPDNKGRYIPMDIFPSDMVERLDVIKSLTPNMEADATGGVMDLILKTAPERFLLGASFSTGYDQVLFDRSFQQSNYNIISDLSPQQVHPNAPATLADFPAQIMDFKHIQPMPNVLANFTVGDRIWNDKLGILVSGGYQDIYTGMTSEYITLDRQANPAPTPNTPLFDDIQNRTYSREDKRWDIMGKFDYRFNTKHSIELTTLYVGMESIRERNYSDTLVSVPVGQVEHHYESKVTKQDISEVSIRGLDTLAHNLFLDYKLAYGTAFGSTPDWMDIGTINNAWSSGTARWQSNTDENISQYINLGYKFNLFGQTIDLQTGAMNRNTNRDNFYDEYSLTLSTLNATNGVYNMYLPHGNPSFNITDSLGTPHNPNNYTVHENVYAGYGMAKITVGKRIEVLGGIRMEHTNQTYSDAESIYTPGQHGTKDYQDILPSAQIRFKINDAQTIRAGYFASITRPDFFEIVPYSITGEVLTEIGNPYLKHSTADNIDIRYEYFPKPGVQLLAGVFYKNINDPIELNLVPGSGPSAQYMQPVNNANPATNYGFEFVATKMIHHFGISINYTYTHSEITTPKLLFYEDVNGHGTDKLVNETNPLQGQADHIANVSLLYKNPNMGWNAALTLNYTGKNIYLVNPDYGFDIWQMPTTNLNLSVEKKISKKYDISVFGKIKNILNTPVELRLLQNEPTKYQVSNGAVPTANFYLPWQNTTSSVLVQRDIYGQSYLVGIRYKF